MNKKQKHVLLLGIALIALFLLLSNVITQPLIIGKNTDGAEWWYVGQDQKCASVYSTSGETVDTIYVRIRNSPTWTTSLPSIRGVIYSADGALLGYTNEIQLTRSSADTTFAWRQLSLATSITLPAGDYYLGIIVGVSGAVHISYDGTGFLSSKTVTDAYADGPSSTFGTTDIYESYSGFDVYALIFGAPTPPPPTPTPSPTPSPAPTPPPGTTGTLNVTAFNLGVEISCSVRTELSPDHYRNDWTPVTIELEAGSYDLTATYVGQTLTETATITAGQTTDVIFQFNVVGPTPSPSPTPMPTEPPEPMVNRQLAIIIVVIASVVIVGVAFNLRRRKET